MPILPSAGKHIQELLRQLESTSAAVRESAVARLTLLGPRTIPHLRSFLSAAGPAGRLAALEVLERLAEVRGLDSVLPLTLDPDDAVARRAMEVAAAFPDPRAAEALRSALSSRSSSRRRAAVAGLGRLHQLGLVEAVLPLLDMALDVDEEEGLRLLALESLSSLRRTALRPALQTLSKDKNPAVARAAAALHRRLPGAPGKEAPPAPEADDATLLSQLVSARSSSAEVSATLAALVERRSPALLSLLGQRLETLREKAAGPEAESLARSKARIHLALGALGSRLALHDLREMLKARPLYAARDLLTAAEAVGDAALVPALVGAAADEPQLAPVAATALLAIVRREKLRRTSRVVKGLGPAHQAALEKLWPAQRAGSSEASRERNRKLR